MSREIIRKELLKKFNELRRGIIEASVRFGKTRLGLMAIKKEQKVLICYPRKAIKKAWEDEIEKLDKEFDIEYSTFRSLKKHNADYDFIIVDEIHKASAAERAQIMRLSRGKDLLGLTGTLGFRSLKVWERINVPVIAKFGLEEAIDHGFVKDYRIFIRYLNLSPANMGKYKFYTAKIEEQIENSPGYKYFVRLRSELLYNSGNLTAAVKKDLEKLKDEKVLIFSLRTDVADKLGKSYHSKSSDNSELEDFKLAESGHLSTVDMVSEGVTIHNLNHIVCHTVTRRNL